MITGKISTLKNTKGGVAFPITTANAVYMDDGSTKLNDKIEDIETSLEHLESEVNELKEGNIDVDIDLTNYVTKSELSFKADKSELHSHSNKNVLDQISTYTLGQWNGHINNLEAHITASERTKWNNKLDKSSIIMSTLEPSYSDGNDGDIWIMYEELKPLLSISIYGTTVYPLTHKEYMGTYNHNSELINDLDGNLYFTGLTLKSDFTVKVESDEYVYRFLDYWTGTLTDTNYTGEATVNGLPTGLLEVMNRATSKIYYYRVLGTSVYGYSYGTLEENID